MSLFIELKRRNVFRVGIAYSVAAWLLIQVTDIVFPRIGLPDSAVMLVIALLAIGFIPALILAWAFELTPDGIKKEAEVDRSESITSVTGRKLDRAIIGVLVVALAYFVFDKFSSQDPAPQMTDPVSVEESAEAVAETEAQPANRIQSVAVLPFTSMSSGVDDGYFADGLTEEILNSLARLPELLVTARTSSFHFKDKNLPIPEIAATLGVDTIVEGSVRRSGDRVRITAQLIRAEDGFHLWSDTYDRTLEDVFSVQEDIAESIAETLDVVLSEDKRRKMHETGIRDVEAFIAFQKGINAYNAAHDERQIEAELAIANEWFDAALEIVPDLSNAWYGRTDRYGHILYSHATNMHSYDDAEVNLALTEIQSSLDKAWQAADNPVQRAILDAERTVFTQDWTGLKGKLDRAFETPDCVSTNWITSFAAPYGWADSVVRLLKKRMLCDPLSFLVATNLVLFETLQGNADAAVVFAGDYMNQQGFHPWVSDAHFLALLSSGQYRNDPDIFDPNPEGSYFGEPRTVLVHAKNGDIEAGRKVLDDWLLENKVDDSSMLVSEAVLGNREAANHYASLIDARVGGTLVLIETIKGCVCGALFDLSATPNFQKRISEAGLSWPPVDAISFPAKDW